MGARGYGISLRVFDNPRMKIVKCVGAKVQDERMRWNNTKPNDGRNFQYTKFSGFDLFLTDRYRAKIGCRLSIFVLSREKCHCQNHWIRNFRFSFPFIGFFPLLGKFERHCLRAILIFSVFERPLSEKIPTNDLGLRMVMASPFIHQLDWVARKESDVSVADWRYQTHVGKYDICKIYGRLRYPDLFWVNSELSSLNSSAS